MAHNCRLGIVVFFLTAPRRAIRRITWMERPAAGLGLQSGDSIPFIKFIPHVILGPLISAVVVGSPGELWRAQLIEPLAWRATASPNQTYQCSNLTACSSQIGPRHG
jgi:hypothetical protein